jgi:V/A-type H+/Na+-transporting ATPase subunit F
MVFFCIADKESSLGFKLAGILTREASNRAEALEALQEARANKDTGVILITDRAAAYIEEEIKVQIDSKPIPLVLRMASRGQKPSRKSSAELLKGLGGIGV